MNTPSPLVPQGSLPGAGKGKANIRIAVFTILAIHIVLLGGLLMQGCKKEPTPSSQADLYAQQTDLGPLPSLSDSNYVSTLPIASGPTTPDLEPPTPGPSTPRTVPTPGPTESLRTAAPPLPAQEPKDYAIVQGDTLGKIAKAHGVSVKAILDLNPGIEPRRLQIRQRILIPPPSASPSKLESRAVDDGSPTYIVKPRDTLWGIARKHGTTVPVLQQLNQLKSTRLQSGQTLRLPAKPIGDTASLGASLAPPPIATSNLIPRTDTGGTRR